jgi:hypothetical protein
MYIDGGNGFIGFLALYEKEWEAEGPLDRVQQALQNDIGAPLCG